ncbi:MAG: hypothetical protein Q9M37_03135 [Desulfonauticus sp.]|nr:hypothetical protein [Desulfonauticus sp.]
MKYLKKIKSIIFIVMLSNIFYGCSPGPACKILPPSLMFPNIENWLFFILLFIAGYLIGFSLGRNKKISNYSNEESKLVSLDIRLRRVEKELKLLKKQIKNTYE